MKITPESKPISEIFSIEGRDTYKIPLYQRNYSWSAENIEELFNDINNESTGYYIGNLLVTIDHEANSKTYLVIDGQQRLTTIALFYIALYQYIEENCATRNNGESIKQCIATQADIMRKIQFEYGVTKLQLLEKDQEIYQDFLKLFIDEPLSKFGNRTFVKRYNFILELFNEEFIEIEDVLKFYDKLNQVEILRIIAENINDAFTIFSSINAKGLPLTLIDLMKSSYLGEATKSGVSQIEATEKWDELVSVFTDSNGNTNSTAITQFLLNNYDTFYGKSKSSITKKSALKQYQNLFNTSEVHRNIESLIKNAKLFSHMSPLVEPHFDYEFTEDQSKALNTLKRLDSSQAYPILMYILNELKTEERVSNEDVEEILYYLVKFFVRRNLVLKPKSSNIRAKIIECVRNIEKKRNLDYVKEIKKVLKEMSVKDEEFHRTLLEGVYDISPQTVRFLLIDIERNHGKEYFSKQNEDTLDQYKTTRGEKRVPIWTLEHILPTTKSLKNGWPNMISPDNVDFAGMLQQYNVHKIGNLTLTGYNSEMSDKSFIEKRDYKASESKNNYTGLRTALFINQSIAEEGVDITMKDKWTIDDIDRRTKILAKIIIEDYEL